MFGRLRRRLRLWYLRRHVLGLNADEDEAFLDELDRGKVSLGDAAGRRRAVTRAQSETLRDFR